MHIKFTNSSVTLLRLNRRTDLDKFRYRDRLNLRKGHRMVLVAITNIHAVGTQKLVYYKNV